MNANTLSRFGHHADPATDFCVEVEELVGEEYNLRVGFSTNKEEFKNRLAKAMDFCVGGDKHAIAAKEVLRECEARLDEMEG